jgi:hypothetical protein
MKRRMVEGERAGRMWKNTEKSIHFSALSGNLTLGKS